MKKKMKKPQSPTNKAPHQSTILIQITNQQHPIAIKVPAPCQASTLKQILKTSLLPNQIQTHYLQSNDKDWLTDYKLQMNSGWINKNCKFKLITKTTWQEAEQSLERYDILKCIGIGGFSKVYMARDKCDGTFYAAKFIEKKKLQDKEALILNEISINRIISFPFLVRMKGFVSTQAYYVMILQYCPGGQLFNLQRKVMRLTQSEAKKYFLEVLFAIEYLHSHNIIYRDLKPENIMLDINGHVKITDFGLAKISTSKRFSYCGSLEYMSPEIISKQGHSFEVDYYCLGVLLYEMVVGCPPFYQHKSSEQETKCRILYSDIAFPEDLQLTGNLKNFLNLLLEKNPSKRLGHMAGIREIKCHPWLGWINKQSILQQQMKMPYEVDLNQFNFDSNDIPDSADRILYHIQHEKLKLRKTSKSKNSKDKSREKSKEKKLLSKKQSQSNYKSLTNIYNSQIRPAQLAEKSQNKLSREKSLKRKKETLSNEHLRINKFQNIKKRYFGSSQIKLNKFMRFPTEICEKKSPDKGKERRTYMKMDTETKQNFRQKEGLKKKKAREQYIFNKIKK